MEKYKPSSVLAETGKHAAVYLKMLIKWTILATIAGVICGILGSLFHHCVTYATSMRQTHDWLILLLPFAGLLIIFCYRKSGVRKDEGTNLVISAIRHATDVPANMTYLIFISTVLTHLCGGSTGREGAALQIGGSLGYTLGRIFRLDENEKRIITMCGMSALFSALFGTPLAAAVFSMEVITVGIMHYSAFLPCTLSSLIAYQISLWFGIVPMSYSIDTVSGLDFKIAIMTVIIALVSAAVAAVFVKTMHIGGKKLVELIPNQYLRIFAGGLVLVALTFASGTRMYNGAGTETIDLAFTGTVAGYVFLIKLIFTVITMSVGYKGGEIVPSFFIGATLGNTLGQLCGISPQFGAMIGMICMFCCVVNCPMTSLLIGIELFGAGNVLYMILACAVCFMMSGYYSLYSEQSFAFAKRPLEKTDMRSFSRRGSEWNKSNKQ